MKLIFIFVLVVITANDIESSSPDPPHHHPIYTYTCDEDLSVTFKGVNGLVEIFDGGNSKDCHVFKDPDHKGDFWIRKECFNNTATINDDRVLYVKVYDKNENENENETSVTQSNLIVTGMHIFKITCKPIPKEGVVRYALAETGVKDVDELRPKPNQVASVEMFLKENDDVMSPDVSEVFIGDMFFMYLNYTGEMSYTLHPDECYANRGNWRLQTAELVLWGPSSGTCLTNDATNYKIMDRFVRDSETMVHAKLHGFRFAKSPDKSGDDDITITCKVKICKGDCSGIDQKCKLTTTHIRRRRRQINSDITTQTVSRKIKVKDTGSNSGGHTTFNRSILLLMVVMTFLNR